LLSPFYFAFPVPNHPHHRISPVTLHQVAARAGVSHQTVSRVINQAPHVTEQTRERVMEAISALGYRPNKAARNLVSQRSTLIGVITFCQDSYGPSHALISIDRAAMQNGYNTLLASVVEPTIECIRRAAEDLLTYGVDGIILNVPIEIDLDSLQGVLGDGPYVVMDASGRKKISTVTIDHESGSRLGTEYLIDLGHRRIACISGPLNWRCARLRREGWLKTLRKSGLTEGPSIEGEWSGKGGYIAAQRLIERYPRRFTAIVAGNDQMALGVIRALSEAGLRVPQDVSVIGFDDMPEAAFFSPSLTTLTHDFEKLGRASFELVVRLIQDPNAPPDNQSVRPELICRESTAKRLKR
jgi:DNA-binding LacI/PurR family transcriptional regulator